MSTDYNNTPTHISLAKNIGIWPDCEASKMCVWADGHPNATIGNCIGGLKGRLISMACKNQLPFVCEK